MRGYLYAIASALLYGSLAVISKLVYNQGLQPFTLIVIMGSVASLLMWLIVVVTRSNHWRLNRGAIRPVVVQAIAGNFINSISYFVALSYIDASIDTLILFTSPAFVLLLEVFVDKKRLNKRHLAALIMCLVGMVTVINPFPLARLTVNAFGISLAIAASLSLAFGNWLGGKKHGAKFAFCRYDMDNYDPKYLVYPDFTNLGLSRHYNPNNYVWGALLYWLYLPGSFLIF